MSDKPNAEIETYRKQIDKQLKDIPEETRFQPKQLTTFSPFQIKSHRQLFATTVRKDGKGLFESTSQLITITPKRNPKLEINVVMFQNDWDAIRALITLYGSNCYLNAEMDNSTKPAEMIYTYASSPV